MGGKKHPKNRVILDPFWEGVFNDIFHEFYGKRTHKASSIKMSCFLIGPLARRLLKTL